MCSTVVSPFQGFGHFVTHNLGLRAARFTPGYNISGLQPDRSAWFSIVRLYRMAISDGCIGRVYRYISEARFISHPVIVTVLNVRGLKARSVTAWAEGPGKT